jgi:uncharacterized membrane protein YfcA
MPRTPERSGKAGIPMIALFVLIAFVPSIIGAICGIGGGIIIKPVLDFASEHKLFIGTKEINFLSGCTVFTMSAVSLLRGRNSGVRFEAGRGTAMAVGAAIGGLCGRLLFTSLVAAIHQNLLGAIQSAVLIGMTIAAVFYTRKKDSITKMDIRFLPFCGVLGLGMGMASAFLGIGGGPINIMAISFFLSMDSKTAALHSLFVIFLSQLTSLALSIKGGFPVQPASLAAMAAGGAAGALIGSHITRKIRNEHVDRLFIILMLIVIALSAYNMINFIQGL